QLHPQGEHRTGGLQAAQPRDTDAIRAAALFTLLLERNRLAAIDPENLPHVTHHHLPSLADGFAKPARNRQEVFARSRRNLHEGRSEGITNPIFPAVATT